jgi:pectate lyase
MRSLSKAMIFAALLLPLGCVSTDPITYDNIRVMRNNIHLFVDHSDLPDNTKGQMKSQADKALAYEDSKWGGAGPSPGDIEVPNE